MQVNHFGMLPMYEWKGRERTLWEAHYCRTTQKLTYIPLYPDALIFN